LSVVIKVFFTVLVLCTVAVVAVVLAIHFRVKRHLGEQSRSPASPEIRLADAEKPEILPSPAAVLNATEQPGEERVRSTTGRDSEDAVKRRPD
jgi:hypothetical protein